MGVESYIADGNMFIILHNRRDIMKVYELLKELPHDKFMPLLLGVCETARSVAIEALSDTENYPKIVECLAKAND